MLGTLAIVAFEQYLGVPNASSVYLVSVVAAGIVLGTRGAIVAAVAAFLAYDFLFVQPLYTFTVADAGEWLNLILLLFVGIVVGQLVALLRGRAEMAAAREREARAQFQVSRVLATRASMSDALPVIADLLMQHAGMERVWISLGSGERESVAADTASGPRPEGGVHRVLRRMPGDAPAEWIRIHDPARRRASARADASPFRVRIEIGGTILGSIWGNRSRRAGEPTLAERRLLAGAADQIGQALEQERLASEARDAEIARQSDALKSALLESVSHDLRTPLASIRAAAGTLGDPQVELSPEDRRISAQAIDDEAEYLNRLVTNLLDLSRIEAGALRADRDVFSLEDLVRPVLERLKRRLGTRAVELVLKAPPAVVDPVLVEQMLTNVVENAIKYTPADARLRIGTRAVPDRAVVTLTVEDSGPGVPDAELPRLFDKFYRVRRADRLSRPGTGIGLAVVRGLAEAMGGQVTARRSDLGGLAIDIDLPLANVPAELAGEGVG
jgi:two-component system sensor histidine kinase KdpD